MTLFDICMLAIAFCFGILVEYFRLSSQLKDCAAEYDKAVRYIDEQDKQLAIYRKHFAKEVNRKNEHY